MRNTMAVSPIPSIKGTWGKFNSPNITGNTTKLASPETAYYKSPFVLQAK